MPKRQRTSSFTRTPRPVDKALISVSKSSVGATQVSTTLVNVSFPCTIMGIRWSIATDRSAGTGTSNTRWAIVKVEDGDSANNMVLTDASSFYQPEQNVLAYGVGAMEDEGPDSIMFEGTTKTMRKMKVGDSIAFIVVGVATNTHNCNGVIQLFCKT